MCARVRACWWVDGGWVGRGGLCVRALLGSPVTFVRRAHTRMTDRQLGGGRMGTDNRSRKVSHLSSGVRQNASDAYCTLWLVWQRPLTSSSIYFDSTPLPFIQNTENLSPNLYACFPNTTTVTTVFGVTCCSLILILTSSSDVHIITFICCCQPHRLLQIMAWETACLSRWEMFMPSYFTLASCLLVSIWVKMYESNFLSTTGWSLFTCQRD